ncbi:MAG: DNA adenine methylase [Planctomycetes bacterium]|nr:DNA adenine methylase [Planctomycetota bacterium]
MTAVLVEEDPAFLASQLVTCIGNKRALLPLLGQGVKAVRDELGGRPLRVWDAFAGSGVVSRFLKQHAALLIASDLEPWAAVAARCHLSNEQDINLPALHAAHSNMLLAWQKQPVRDGFVRRLYAPADETAITTRDRVFYTVENACRLDTFRQAIGRAPAALRDLLLAPLLAEASVHANTAGVFKGFYKDRRTGLGRFGGSHGDALARIRGPVQPGLPVLSRFCCEVQVHQGDTNALAGRLPELDLAYLDPPYNQHPYGSNYFMLNLLAEYREPGDVSPVSGIPPGWRRSEYNRRRRAAGALAQLLATVPARRLLVSYSNEGFIGLEEMLDLLAARGEVRVFERRYNAFRGCRNLRNRARHVTEFLFLAGR